MSDSLQPHGLEPIRLFCPQNSSGKNPRVGCHFLLQGIFPTQGLNPDLLHCRQILYQLTTREVHYSDNRKLMQNMSQFRLIIKTMSLGHFLGKILFALQKDQRRGREFYF